tara:strand:- start:46 stop:660 length:615 start_codon:yes stop_codon:yes gene_type:complete
MSDYIEQGLSHGETSSLTQGNFYWTVPNAISDEVCKKIIDRYEDLEQFESSQVADGQKNIRKSQSVFDNLDWVFDLIWPVQKEVNQLADWHFKIDAAENYQVTKYEEGDFYSAHIDSLGTNGTKRIAPDKPNLHNRTRKMSMTLNLNDPSEYEGGELRLYGVGKLPTDKGRMTFFPSFLPHEVTPVTKGVRYSLVVWFLGTPWE